MRKLVASKILSPSPSLLINKRTIIDIIPAYNKSPLRKENVFINKTIKTPIKINTMFILFASNKSNTAKKPKAINRGSRLNIILSHK